MHLFNSSTGERSSRDQSGLGEDSAGGGGDHTSGGGVWTEGHVTQTEAAAEGETHPTEPANHTAEGPILTAEGSNHPTEGEIAAPGETKGKRTGAEPWGCTPETSSRAWGRDLSSVCPVEACTLQDLSWRRGTGVLLSLQTHHIMWGLCGQSPWENMPHV